MGVEQVMADPKEMIDSLNKQISELKSQVKSAALEMEMMRARMNDLSQDAKQAVQIERFVIPDDDRLGEINDLVDLMDKAIKKNRRSHRAQTEKAGRPDSAPPSKVDERVILIVLKLRRKGCYIREIAAHTGLAHGTVHNIIKKYGSDPQMQSLVTEGTQMELTDYLLIRPKQD
jgi:uncharacterized coiled-coil protein SlyX/lambda repressor-like predicted transcriptional regulator